MCRPIHIFLKERFAKANFFGRTFSLLFIYFLLGASLFSVMVAGLFGLDSIGYVDTHVADALFLLRDSALVKVFLWITVLGKSKVIIFFAPSVVLMLWLMKKKDYILPLLITVSGATFVNFFCKSFFHRSRPEMSLFLENTFSFPSGHATISVAFYGFIAYVLVKEVKTWKVKVSIISGAILLVALIGFSRLYLGVHYLSDVLGGHLLGVLWLIIGVGVVEYSFGYKKVDIRQSAVNSNNIKLVYLILLVDIIFYIFFAANYNPMV